MFVENITTQAKPPSLTGMYSRRTGGSQWAKSLNLLACRKSAKSDDEPDNGLSADIPSVPGIGRFRLRVIHRDLSLV
jgi:hypothetical protein